MEVRQLGSSANGFQKAIEAARCAQVQRSSGLEKRSRCDVIERATTSKKWNLESTQSQGQDGQFVTMPDDEDYVLGKRSDMTYISKEFPIGNEGAKRYVSRVFDERAGCDHVEVDGEILIRSTPGGRQQIKALFRCLDRKVETLVLQRFSSASGRAHKDASFFLRGDEISRLLTIDSFVRDLDLTQKEKFRVSETVNTSSTVSLEQARLFASRHPDLFVSILEAELTDRDVVSIGYRRRQLERFRRMLEDDIFFDSERRRGKGGGSENVWQRFFEENHWIFGYGLSYVFTTTLDDKKLEQIVAGASVHSRGKRVDGLLRTRGRVSSLCFVEIKAHTTALLQPGPPFRPDAWAISHDLAGAIAQVQRSVQSAQKQIGSRFDSFDRLGNPTGESAYLYHPKSIVIIGSLTEFQVNGSINESKFGSFELFRRQLQQPEVITFDELYERARFIIDAQS